MRTETASAAGPMGFSGARKNPRLIPAITVLAALLSAPLFAFEWSQENSCVLFNSCNSNILLVPDECFLPENQPWCSCTRMVLTQPVQGATSGLEIGTIWVTDQDGIGNFRAEIDGGTLDLEPLEVGEVIGGTLTNELVPEAIGVPPGTFFTVRGEIRISGQDENGTDFEVVVVELSPISRIILGYDPTDARHSDGVLYRGRITPNGPGRGFVLEYRYVGENASIEIGDAASPGFNVRFAISFFTEGTDAERVYTLPMSGNGISVETVIRRFPDDDPTFAEVVALDEDLCQVIAREEPCRLFDQFLPISPPGANNPPTADICPTDARTLDPLEEGVFVECGEGRAILRGSNSTDGENGAQGLSYLWEVVEGSEGGAVIPAETATFMDTEVSFLIPDLYTIRLTVDDGQPENNVDTEEVVINAIEGFQLENSPPEIFALWVDGVELLGLPDPLASLQLVGGEVTVEFEVDGTTGPDGCLQELSVLWEQVSGPGDAVIADPTDDDTNITFTVPGEYELTVTLDDGAPENNVTTATFGVIVEAGDSNTFRRCDANGSGATDLSDAAFIFNFLFLGGPEARCAESMRCNNDRAIDLSDGVFLLNFLFLGGPSPAEPFPACDSAPVEDCAESTPC